MADITSSVDPEFKSLLVTMLMPLRTLLDKEEATVHKAVEEYRACIANRRSEVEVSGCHQLFTYPVYG